jgi:urease accessory protein
MRMTAAICIRKVCRQRLIPQMTVQNDPADAPQAAVLLARMLQFGDSMFPIGGFSFSCGLESAIQKGVVADTATLAAYTRTAVEQAARGDGIGLIAAHGAAAAGDFNALMRIDEMVFGRKLSEEARTMTVRMGKKFTEIGAQVIDAPLVRRWCEYIAASATPGCFPISLAINFVGQNLSVKEAFVVHQYGVATMILSAALRLMRISHIDTQAILYDLNTRVDADYRIAAQARLSDMAGYAPLTEILAAVHTKAHVRLFMS